MCAFKNATCMFETGHKEQQEETTVKIRPTLNPFGSNRSVSNNKPSFNQPQFFFCDMAHPLRRFLFWFAVRSSLSFREPEKEREGERESTNSVCHESPFFPSDMYVCCC